MRRKLSLAATAFAATLALMTLGLGLVSACTFANGHDNFTYDLAEQRYAVREGALKAGEQAAFSIRGGAMDVFVFNEDQYYSYVDLGTGSAGWRGAAAYKSLGVSSVDFVFTAPAEGKYYLVMDNTVAGADPGANENSVILDVMYPYSNVDNPAFPFYFPLVISGIAVFGLVVLAAFSRK